MKNIALVIVPCGQKKIWDDQPDAGPTAGKDAYTGPPFGINRAFAEKYGKRWIILTALYGFIDPTFKLPGPYNVTFKRKNSGPISVERLREQVHQYQLGTLSTIIGLGGKEYRQAIELAFSDKPARLHFPFSGLPIGKSMQATKRAIVTNDPLWERKQLQ